MKNLTIILDAAHGEEVPGKRSPDGLFREYKWSRQIISKLKSKLIEEGYIVYETNPTDKEIGLSQRTIRANAFEGKNKLFISLHSDAAGNGSDWMQARGYSIFTSPGQTKSDKYAEVFLKQLKEDFPELRMRKDESDGDLDKEANLYVLKKTNCPAILIEWCFQDNKEDIKILLDSEYNKRLVNSLINSIEELNDTLN